MALMGGGGNAYKFSIKNHEGRSTLGRPRHRWGIILKWFINKMGGNGLDYVAGDGDKLWTIVNLLVL